MSLKKNFSTSPGKDKMNKDPRVKDLTPIMKGAGFTVLDFVVGAFVGGAIGSALGKWSILAGVATNYIGHRYEIHAVSSMGVGMMACGYANPKGTVNGVEGTADDMYGLEGAKDRAIAYGKNFAQKLWLDKVIPALKEDATPVSGLGEVQYFVYPNEAPVGQLDMSALERLESQLKQSAQQYAAKQPAVTGFEDVEGLEGALEQRIY